MKKGNTISIGDAIDLPGPYDGAAVDDPWFLPPHEEPGLEPFVSREPSGRLVEPEAWRRAEAALAGELSELAFDAGRLNERGRVLGAGAVQRLALEEAAALSWWTGDRVGADRLALWLSYRIGAAEEGGEGLIRTAWAARRLMAAPSSGLAATVIDLLGEAGRGDAFLAEDFATALDGVAGLTPVARGCVVFHLWRSLEERPDHLRGLEAAVLGARMAGQGGQAFLPLALTGFGALTASGSPEGRLAAWISGAHRAVLAALMAQERLSAWCDRARTETADLQGRTPGRLIRALGSHPMLAAAQAEADTGASRAAVLRNLDVLEARGLIREVTGQGRFRVWAARV